MQTQLILLSRLLPATCLSPACLQPMKCLCASKNCRGVIGGAQDREGGAAARAALQAAAVEMAADDPDPDYIMVTGAPALCALCALCGWGV